MNERIQELRSQAEGSALQIPASLKPHEFNEIFDEIFAELIVRECAEVCKRQQYYDADDEHKRGVNSGSYTCMNAIKKHFGVE